LWLVAFGLLLNGASFKKKIAVASCDGCGRGGV